MVRALASHQCGLGSIPGPGVIYGLSLFLVLSLLREDFLRVLRFVPCPQKPIFLNSNSNWKARSRMNEFLRALRCYVGKYYYHLPFLPFTNNAKGSGSRTVFVFHTDKNILEMQRSASINYNHDKKKRKKEKKLGTPHIWLQMRKRV